jgi:aspartokinase
MITLSHLGGRVLFRLAAIQARRFGQPLEIRSSTMPERGTMIRAASSDRRRFEEEGGPMETDRALAIALESPVRWVRAESAPDAPRGVHLLGEGVRPPLLHFSVQSTAPPSRSGWSPASPRLRRRP